MREDNYGFTPLHIACYEKTEAAEVDPTDRVSIVQQLVEAYPEGITCRDNKGWMPLHVSARTGTMAMVKTLLELSPKAAAAPDKDNRLPIHLVCLNNNGEERDVAGIAEALATTFPSGLSHRERKFGFLPLHTACSVTAASSILVNSFLRHNAHAVSEEDFFRSTPLHIATRANASYGVISSLVEAFPTAARKQDKDERLPLHWATHSNADFSVIRSLTDANPSGVLVKERKYGYTPLHIALQRSNNEDTVSYLVAQSSDILRVADLNGALPIHLVCEKRTEDANALLETLLIEFPESVDVCDRFGRKPIDLARLRTELELKAQMIIMLQNGHNRRRRISSVGVGSVYSDESVDSALMDTESAHKKGGGNKKEMSPGGLCVICLENSAVLVLYPCGHICLCEECGSGSNLSSLNQICPVGRCKFVDAVKVYGLDTVKVYGHC